MCHWVKSKDTENECWFIECLQCGDNEFVENENIEELGIPAKGSIKPPKG